MIDPDSMNNIYKCSWCDTTFPDPYYASLDYIKHYLEKEDIMDWWINGTTVYGRKLIKTRENQIMGGGYFGYKKVIFNPPATIVIWNDNTKTVVKCGPNDYYDPEKGLALCFMKRAFSNDNNKFHKVFNKALKDGSMTGYAPFPMTPVEFNEFYEEYLKLKEDKDADSDRESAK